MPGTSCARWFAAALLLLASACDSQDGGDPAGGYQIRGHAAGNARTYIGELRIAPFGPGYDLIWRLDQGDMYRGTALLADHVLGAVYWIGPRPTPDISVAVFAVKGGTLTGTWMPAIGGVPRPGREELAGPENLNGSYDIVVGENPDGSSYKGHVEITRTGKTYWLRWYLPELTYVGRGVRVGDKLVVGYASRIAPGVVAYCMMGENGKGVWSFGNANGLGTELISQNLNKDAFGESNMNAIESRCAEVGA